MLVLAVKSLFLFVPAILIFGATLGIRSDLDEFKKYRRWGELLNVIVLMLAIGFYLLLIGLFIRTLVTKG